MKNELDTREILAVFDKIRRHGTPHEQGHLLDGMLGLADHDGYTVYLQTSQVKLRTGFHNTYKLEYESQRDADKFLKHLKQINRDYD